MTKEEELGAEAAELRVTCDFCQEPESAWYFVLMRKWSFACTTCRNAMDKVRSFLEKDLP